MRSSTQKRKGETMKPSRKIYFVNCINQETGVYAKGEITGDMLALMRKKSKFLIVSCEFVREESLIQCLS